MERLVRILETEQSDGVIIFVKTRNSTIVVSEGLVQKGIIASPFPLKRHPQSVSARQ